MFNVGDTVECLGAIGVVVEKTLDKNYPLKVLFKEQNYVVNFTEDGKIKNWMKTSILKKLESEYALLPEN